MSDPTRPHALPPARVTVVGWAWLTDTCRKYRVSKSDVIRESLAVASKHEKELSALLEERLREQGRF